jgi:hypothetical protein
MRQRDAIVFYQDAFRAGSLNTAFDRSQSRKAGGLPIHQVEFARDRQPWAISLNVFSTGSDDDLGRTIFFVIPPGVKLNRWYTFGVVGFVKSLLRRRIPEIAFSSRLIPFVSKGSRTMRLEIELDPGGSAKFDASNTLRKAGSIIASCDEACDSVIFATSATLGRKTNPRENVICRSAL